MPQIHNNDQGAQFTSGDYVQRLEAHGIQISWDGRGRVYDNIFVERLWRTVKYEYLYLHDYPDGRQLEQGLSEDWRFYNEERPHQALGNRRPERHPPQSIKQGRNSNPKQPTQNRLKNPSNND